MTKDKKVRAIILDGRHGGQTFIINYTPHIKIPIESMIQISIGEKYDETVKVGDSEIYYECFRAVDRRIVLYSKYVNSEMAARYLMNVLLPTYPVRLY